MLTATQVATGAYITEDGELLCEQCFEQGDVYAKPVSNYGLDEWQSETAADHDWYYQEPDEAAPEGVDPNEFHAECEPALYDNNGHELRDSYHYHREPEPTPLASVAVAPRDEHGEVPGLLF